MRIVAWTVGAVTLVVAAAYTIVSLARWEWNRALFFGLAFVAAELGLVAGAVLSRLARLDRKLDLDRVERDRPHAKERALEVLERSRADHDRFPWLQVDPTDVVTRTNVFITLVVGGGVLLSGGAWVVDKVAARTVDPGRESRLAGELTSIAYPEGLLIDDMEARARSRPDVEDDRLRDLLSPRP